METAFAALFPGQGSQRLGMGKALAEGEALARELFLEADQVLGFPLSRLCWEGPQDDLNETANTQPALLTHSVAVWRVFCQRFPQLKPSLLAGHSVGEFSALVAGGALDFKDGLRLVRARGQAMRDAALHSPGGMAAVLGLSIDQVRSALNAVGEGIWVANDNCPGQVVISGQEEALKGAMERLKEAGARRVIRLRVSIPAHTPLMAQAQERFNEALAAVELRDSSIPILGNVTAEPITRAAALREELRAQLTSPVRWRESMLRLADMEVPLALEMGPGEVLCGLLRRTAGQIECRALDAPQSFMHLAAAIQLEG
jgi:[acyl-carrier-protein] S-malonyltransferase